MKIVPIFDDKLYSFHYDNEDENELDRLLNDWNNVSYLYGFVSHNLADIPGNKTKEAIVKVIIDNATDIDNTLYELAHNMGKTLDEFFRPLNNSEYRMLELSKQKGRKNFLRIYALRIEKNCFVITGGAIKFTHLMQDRPHTQHELKKIEICRIFLKENGVYDSESFYEFLTEQS